MDWDEIEENWKQAKGKIKEKWGKLTDGDLDAIEGRRSRLEDKSISDMVSPAITYAKKSMIGSDGKLQSLAVQAPARSRADIDTASR